MTITDEPTATPDELPRWSVADVYPSLDDRAFTDALETLDADVTRLIALFDEHDIRQVEPRTAKSLGMSYDQLRHLVRKHGLGRRSRRKKSGA